MTAFAPCSTARDSATVMPRSLNEPVGFIPSYLTHTSVPVRRDSAGAGRSGVPPSPRVTTVEASVTPSRSAYSRRPPRPPCALSVSFPAQHRHAALDHAAPAQARHDLPQALFACFLAAAAESPPQ